jgi:hypothetical protein
VDKAELQAAQKPLKDRYREDPEAAFLTLRAEGQLDEQQIACSVATGRSIVEAGLHPATGGNGTLACSGDMLLEALVACSGVTPVGRASMELDVSGSDRRGRPTSAARSVDREAPVGFTAIRLRFELLRRPEEALAKLLELTERYRVSADLAGGVPARGATPPRRPSGSRRRSRSPAVGPSEALLLEAEGLVELDRRLVQGKTWSSTCGRRPRGPSRSPLPASPFPLLPACIGRHHQADVSDVRARGRGSRPIERRPRIVRRHLRDEDGSVRIPAQRL